MKKILFFLIISLILIFPNIASAQTNTTLPVKIWNQITAPSPDGNKIAITYSDYYSLNISIWDINSGSLIKIINNTELGAESSVFIKTIETSLMWSPDGKKIATRAKTDIKKAVIYILDYESGLKKVFPTFPTDYFDILSWSSDSKKIYINAVGSIQIWDADKGTLIKNISTPSGTTPSNKVSLSPDEKKLAFTDGEKIIGILDIDTGAVAEIIKVDRSRGFFPSSVSWSPDGKKIASGWTGGTIRIYDISTKNEVIRASVESEINVDRVFWSPDGKKIITQDQSTLLYSGRLYKFSVIDVSLPKPVSENKPLFETPIYNSEYSGWSRDGRVLVIGEEHKNLVVYKFYESETTSGGRSPTQVDATTTTASPTSSIEQISPKASFRENDWSLKESSNGILSGVKEGNLVWLEPVGNVLGKKVEWFDEWNGKKYKIITPYFLKDYVIQAPSMKIEVSKDKNYSAPAANIKAGDKLYIRTNSSEYIFLSASYTKKDGSTIDIGWDVLGFSNGSKEQEFVVPDDFGKGLSFSSLFKDLNDIETNISITLPIDGSSISKESLAKQLLRMRYEKKTVALGIDKEITRVFDNSGIYRYFAKGEHSISLVVDGEEKGKIKINVAKLPVQKTIKVGVVLTLYDNIKPIRCGDGRDRDGDGFTGYGKDDDCDGWDKYEYENNIFSQVNKYYYEASNGRVGFDWKIFDNDGNWVYVAPNPLHGGQAGLLPILAADAIEAATGETRGSFTGIEGKIMVVLPADLKDKLLQSRGGSTGYNGDTIIAEDVHMGIVSHELGHSLGQMTELYPTPQNVFGPSDIKQWSVMGSSNVLGNIVPSLMDAHTRIKTGWNTEDVINKDGKYLLQQANKASKVLTVRTDPVLSYIAGTRFLIEARTQNPALTYYDRGAPDTAVVVYKVVTLASGIDQVTIAGTLENVGDKIIDVGRGAYFKLTKNNLETDGTAEVEIGTGLMSNVVGAVADAAGQAGEALQDTGEAIADSAGDAAESVSNFIGGLFGGKSGPALNETLDLDLHAYYNLDGKQFHIGMNYQTGKYETQLNTISSGDLGVGEYIFVPDNSKDLQFKVANKKLKDYYTKHPEAVKEATGNEKFSIAFIKYDSQGKRTLTNPEINSIKLSDTEKTFSMPTAGFAEQQTVKRFSADEIKKRLVVLRDNQIIFSKEFTAKEKPEIQKSTFEKAGNYKIILQSAGPQNEIYFDDSALKQDALKFSSQAISTSDNSLRVMNLQVSAANKTEENPVSFLGEDISKNLGLIGIVVVSVVLLLIIPRGIFKLIIRIIFKLH